MSMTKINWYPGHMKKTKDLIKENMQLIDIVLEVVDARIPLSSKNPDITVFAKNKKRVIVLNKSDLVEKSEILYWKKYFKENYQNVIIFDDVITSGNTIMTCAKVISSYQPKTISIIVMASNQLDKLFK